MLAVEPPEDRAGSIMFAPASRSIAASGVAGVREAHQALMGSPGHRANLMSTEVTHVGIGVVLGAPVSGRRAIYITEIFLRLREAFGTDPCASAQIAGCRTPPVAPL